MRLKKCIGRQHETAWKKHKITGEGPRVFARIEETAQHIVGSNKCKSNTNARRLFFFFVRLGRGGVSRSRPSFAFPAQSASGLVPSPMEMLMEMAK